MSMTENKALLSALEKVKAQKVNFEILERFDVDENFEVTKALEEIQQYRAIGTVEELRELKEKATAKKPKLIRVAKDCEYMTCPHCKLKTVLYEFMRPDWCPNCGGLLDWQRRERRASCG